MVQKPVSLENEDVFSKKIQEDILKAVKSEALEVAGVDIIIDQQTKVPYILEVNRAPQINGGSFTDEKIAAYAAMIDSKLA